jgi:hypothetical protein
MYMTNKQQTYYCAWHPKEGYLGEKDHAVSFFSNDKEEVANMIIGEFWAFIFILLTIVGLKSIAINSR